MTLYRLPLVGDAAPLATIAGTKTGLSWPDGVAVNGARNLFVTNGSMSSTVLEFAPGANGDVSPIAAIEGPKTQLSSPVGIAIDTSGDIWVFNFGGAITEYPPGSTGNVAPVHEINVWDPQYPCGMVTSEPQTIAVDPSDNLWVDCGSMVLEYGPGATNGADPEAVITGPATGLATGLRRSVVAAVMWAGWPWTVQRTYTWPMRKPACARLRPSPSTPRVPPAILRPSLLSRDSNRFARCARRAGLDRGRPVLDQRDILGEGRLRVPGGHQR